MASQNPFAALADEGEDVPVQQVYFTFAYLFKVRINLRKVKKTNFP